MCACQIHSRAGLGRSIPFNRLSRHIRQFGVRHSIRRDSWSCDSFRLNLIRGNPPAIFGNIRLCKLRVARITGANLRGVFRIYRCRAAGFGGTDIRLIVERGQITRPGSPCWNRANNPIHNHQSRPVGIPAVRQAAQNSKVHVS